jgi:hypothetical protein
MELRKLNPLRLGLFGAAVLAGGFGWIAVWMHFNSFDPYPLSDGPFMPMWPRLVSFCGLALVLSALVWALVRWIRRKATGSRTN